MLGSLLLCAACLVIPSLAVKTNVITAREGAEGPPAGLLILPGAFLKCEQYREIAKAIQAASNQRLTVGLSCDFLADCVNPIEVPTALEQGIDKLREAGLPISAPIYAAGHSLAGVFMNQVALDYPAIKGLLLFASYLNEGDLANYKLPVLSVSGDLDGQTRLTRIVKAFKEVINATRSSGNEDLKLKYPISILTDVNHGHFATGEMPPLVKEEDIPSPLDNAEARKRIAKVASTFMSYHTQQDKSSKQALEQTWSTTSKIVEPFITLMEEEQNEEKTSSLWVAQGQRVLSTLSDSDLALVDVMNKIYEPDIEFPFSKPTVEVKNGRLVINTTANVKFGVALPNSPQTASEIEGKMKRQEALKKEAEKGGLRLNFGTPVSCKEVNRAAWERALSKASDIASKRFSAKDIAVNFEEDEKAVTGPGWLLGKLVFKLEGKTLRIKSVSLVTDLDIILGVAGMNYCKLLSPARALEFIYIDALKKPSESYYGF